MNPQEHEPAQDADPSRRRFLGAAGAAGSAAALTAVLGVPKASASTSLAQERAMVLRVARAGTVFPVRLLASDWDATPRTSAIAARLRASQRRHPRGRLPLTEGRQPTPALLRAAEGGMPADQLALARTGADGLIAAGLLSVGQASLLEGIGGYAATASPAEQNALTAAVTLAVSTVFVSTVFASTVSASTGSGVASGAAQKWVGLLRIMYQRGTLGRALLERGVR